MPSKNNVMGQKVDAVKLQRDRELRRQMTPEAKILWEQLRANRLEGFHFRRQQVIDGFMVDFYCHAAGLVIERDGEIHKQQHDYDAGRDPVLQTREICVLRFRNDAVRNNLPEVLKKIVRACRAAG